MMSSDSEDLYCTILPTKPCPAEGTVLVTGATGYIGGRLVPELLARQYRLRVMVRMPVPGLETVWPGAEVMTGDALKPETLGAVLEGVHTAYYLIHSLLLGPHQFEAVDAQAARNFRLAAEKAGVKRIIYLGGLGDTGTELSAHLRSRIQVSNELKDGPIPATILRAAIIIGSGSASYEIIENLIRNAPLIPVPGWAHTLCQPIAVRDVVKYLVGCLETPATAGRTFDIGGPDILSYEGMLKTVADVLGKRRLFVPSPISSIPLLSYGASLITPVPHAITRCLMESIFHEVVCQNNDIRKFIPFEPMTFREAIVRALSRNEQDRVSTRWSDAYPPAHELSIKLNQVLPPPRYIKTYSRLSTKSATSLFHSICRIGGKQGWFKSNWMWYLRGLIDRLLMGVGTSRGRKNGGALRVNDVIDFWRVEDIRADSLLLLRAEMKMPGRAWLRFDITPCNCGNQLSVTAFYDVHTVAGRLYWYFFLPFHHFIFRDLLLQIEARSRHADRISG